MPKGVYKRTKPVWNKGLTRQTDSRIHSAWNKGLTKDTDERVAKWAEASAKTRKGMPGKRGASNPNYGKPLSAKHRRAISLAKMGHETTEETRNLISIRTREGMASDEVRQKCRWRAGLTKETNEGVLKQSVKVKQTLQNKVENGEWVSWNEGLTKETSESVLSQSKKLSLIWEDPVVKSEWIRKTWSSACRKPNKIEMFLDEILQENFPGEWEYVGNGKLVINGLIPDFTNINGKKQLIELFGDYWHKGEDPQIRIDKFAEFGYSCLVIWEAELKNTSKVIERIANF